MSKIFFKVNSVIVLIALIAIMLVSIGSGYVYAEESELNIEKISDTEGSQNDNNYAVRSSDKGGLQTFEIASDPFMGGTHPKGNRTIFCGAQIDPAAFSSNYTDYIVINWDSDVYRYVLNSDAVYCEYYLEFFGQVTSIEKECNFAYLDDGVIGVSIDIERNMWNSWKWSTVNSIFCSIIFELEAVDGEVQEPIFANYYHCTKECEITGVTTSPDGSVTVTWDTNTQYSPIWGVTDYIYD